MGHFVVHGGALPKRLHALFVGVAVQRVCYFTALTRHFKGRIAHKQRAQRNIAAPRYINAAEALPCVFNREKHAALKALGQHCGIYPFAFFALLPFRLSVFRRQHRLIRLNIRIKAYKRFFAVIAQRYCVILRLAAIIIEICAGY